MSLYPTENVTTNIRVSGDGSRLTFLQVAKEDTGNVACMAVNSHAAVEASGYLNVWGRYCREVLHV